MSRTQNRAGQKSARRASRTTSRERRRSQQREQWLRELNNPDADYRAWAELSLPENLRRRWQRRGLLGGA